MRNINALPMSSLRPALQRIATCIAFGAVAACHRAPPATAPPVIVLADQVHPETGTGNEALRYPIEVAARYTTTMSFRVAGKLIERRVRLGDSVRKGQIIARLDPIDAERQAASSDAAFEAAEHRLIFAKQQLDRDQGQAAQNLIAANQLEQTEDAYAAALAARAQAAAQRTITRNALQYSTLTADDDGRITSENADTGQVVTAGQAIYGLAWSGATDVDMDVAASDLGRITTGQGATVDFTALPGRQYAARVRELSPAADPQSRTYRVKLTLVAAGPDVRLGMTGDAVLAAAAPTAGQSGGAATAPAVFRIPATALFHQGKEPAVWVIRAADSTLELHPVAVRAYSDRFATVTRGLQDGDTIVMAGVHTVYAGQRVTPVAPLFAREADTQ